MIVRFLANGILNIYSSLSALAAKKDPKERQKFIESILKSDFLPTIKKIIDAGEDNPAQLAIFIGMYEITYRTKYPKSLWLNWTSIEVLEFLDTRTSLNQAVALEVSALYKEVIYDVINSAPDDEIDSQKLEQELLTNPAIQAYLPQ